MINNRNLIQITNDSVNLKVTTGNDANNLEARGIGKALLKNKLGESIILENALYVPNLNRSLISLSRLFKDNLKISKNKRSSIEL